MEQPVRKSLRQFFTEVKGIKIDFDIYRNKNGYPFIRMLTDIGGEKPGSQLVYLSKAAAQRVEEQGITNLKELRDSLSVVETTNEAGEERLKLSFNGTGYQDFD